MSQGNDAAELNQLEARQARDGQPTRQEVVDQAAMTMYPSTVFNTKHFCRFHYENLAESDFSDKIGVMIQQAGSYLVKCPYVEEQRDRDSRVAKATWVVLERED